MPIQDYIPSVRQRQLLQICLLGLGFCLSHATAKNINEISKGTTRNFINFSPQGGELLLYSKEEEGTTLQSRSNANNILSIHGGDRDRANNRLGQSIVRIGTIIEIMNSAFFCLFPKKCLHFYGISETNPLLEWATRRVGIGLVNHAIISWFTFHPLGTEKTMSATSGSKSPKGDVLIKDTRRNQAIGYGFIPWICAFSLALINNDAQRLGLKPALNAAQGATLGMCTFGAYACFTNAPFATKAVKIISILMTLEGTRLSIAPSAGGEVLGFPSNPTQNYLSGLHGVSLAVGGIFMIGLMSDMDSIKAYGYSLIPYIASLSMSIGVTKDFDMIGISTQPQFLWLFTNAITVVVALAR